MYAKCTLLKNVILKIYFQENINKKIEEFINRLNKPKIYIEGNKSKILELLSKETLTVNELATRLKMTRQGARYLIKELIREDKVEVKSIVKFGNYKYGLR